MIFNKDHRSDLKSKGLSILEVDVSSQSLKGVFQLGVVYYAFWR